MFGILKGKSIKVPDTYVIVFAMMLVAALLTYIVPAGQYEKIVNPLTKVISVNPSSFKFVSANSTGIMDFLTSIPIGLKNGATIIFFTLLIGGYFQIISDTGAIDKTIGVMVERAGEKAFMMIPILMAILSVLGAFGIVLNAVVAFVPIGIVLAKKLKIDPVFGVGVMYLGAYSGFASSPVCPVNVLIAQSLSGLPLMSGAPYRIFVWFFIYVLAVWYVLRYGKMVKKNPSKSIMPDAVFHDDAEQATENSGYTLKDGLIMSTLATGILIFTYGAIKFKWDTDALNGILLAVALISAAISKTSPDNMVKSFINGCKGMLYGVVIIGFANALTVIMTKGKIIDSLIYYLSLPLSLVNTYVAAVLMYWVNIVINFFIPSGSGQAAAVMPIMAPLADVLGISRQTAVLAFQFGDGLSNAIIPTSGVLMATIAAGKVPYDKWLKFMLPLFVLWSIWTTLAMIVAVAIGYQ